MAQTTGLGLSSSSESNVPKPTSSDLLPEISLPNSLMSAPPQKILPLPFRTMPLTASSAERPQSGDEAVEHTRAERVDGRVVDRDDADIGVARHGNQIAHRQVSSPNTSRRPGQV